MQAIVIFDQHDSPVMSTSLSMDVEWGTEVVQELAQALLRRGWSWAVVPDVLLTTLDTMLEDAKATK